MTIKQLRLVESPRDAMQGLKTFIPTEKKIDYIQSLLKVGYDILDFGSFVSPKAIPQMRDTGKVLQSLDLSETNTKLLVVVGNVKGMEIACAHSNLSYIGYPFSVSNTFLKLNINSTIEKSLETIDSLLETCDKKDRQLMVYLSMGFGNPYGDPWSIDIIEEYTDILLRKGVQEINFSDTIGVGTPEIITEIFKKIPPKFPAINFGLHLHTKQSEWEPKIQAAYDNGCWSFDSVLNGLGGCPMTQHEMVGNLNTIDLFNYFDINKINTNIDSKAFAQAKSKAAELFTFTK